MRDMGGAVYRMKSSWASTREKVNGGGNSRWLFRKTVIRFITAHFSLVGFALFAAAIKPWQANFFHMKGTAGDWQDGLPIAPLLLSFLHNGIHTFYVFGHAKPVHALVNGVVDFIVWAILIPAVIFAAWGGVFNLWQKPVLEAGGEVICENALNILSKECFPALYQIGDLELGGIVFAILVWMITTFLFVHGCIETIRSRRYGNSSAPDRSGFYDLERSSRMWNGFTTRGQRNRDEVTRPQMAMPRYR